MKFRILFSYVLFLGNVAIGSDRLFVSLGSSCDVAMQLKEHNLRTQALPFDWLLTLNHEKFLELFDNNFKFFLEESQIFQNQKHPSILENKYYEITFRHDGPVNQSADLSQHLQEVTPKYERRITRFRELRNYPGKVFFIRTAYDFQNGGLSHWFQDNQSSISIEQAKTLKRALDDFFPLLDFTLIIINYKEENVPKIENIDGIFEFKVRKNHKKIDYTILLKKLSHLP